ncbi:MAG: hypothetical protein AAGA66_02730 [Bacteroidota bacterium]
MMKKQVSIFLGAVLLMGMTTSCDRSEVNELEIQDQTTIYEKIGGGHGGDDPDPEVD